MILFFCCSRWINLRLGLITSAIIFLTSLFVILLSHQIKPEYAGLAIVYATQVSQNLAVSTNLCLFVARFLKDLSRKSSGFIIEFLCLTALSLCCSWRRCSSSS